MTEPMEQGLYVAMNVLPTRGLVDYMETVPAEKSNQLDPKKAHVSISYAYEMIASGARDVDPEKIEDACLEVEDRIDALGLDGTAIMPGADRLVPYKRFWVVPITASPPLYEAHRTVSGLVKEWFGVDIATWRDDYHLSVSRKGVGKERGGKPHRVPFPNGFILNGCQAEVNEVPRELPPHLLCMNRAIRSQRDFAAAMSS